jgi:rRNA maturation RNase YbeY
MNEKSIQFFTEDIGYQIKGRGILRRGILQLISEKGFLGGTINIIFCSDQFLRGYNKKYLNHDYYTDVVTFNLSENIKEIAGDIFISLDRVRDNAKTYKVSLKMEIARVIGHGVLHLTGMEDSSEELKQAMRMEEDKFLSSLVNY